MHRAQKLSRRGTCIEHYHTHHAITPCFVTPLIPYVFSKDSYQGYTHLAAGEFSIEA